MSAIAEPGCAGLGFLESGEDAGEPVTVRTDDAILAVGVSVFGEKLQAKPWGKPEQLKETAEEKPFCGVTVTVACPLFPGATVISAGLSAIAKLGAWGSTV